MSETRHTHWYFPVTLARVIGFIVALSGVNSQSVSIAEPVGPMFANKLILGMSITLSTTLVGVVLYLWLDVNHRMLASGTVNLINTLLRWKVLE